MDFVWFLPFRKTFLKVRWVCPFWFAREEKGNPSCCDVVDVEKRERDGIVEMKGQIECVDHSSKMWIDHCGKCANICKQPTLEMSDSWLEQTGCCCSGSFELTWEMDGVKGCRWFTLITAIFMNEWENTIEGHTPFQISDTQTNPPWMYVVCEMCFKSVHEETNTGNTLLFDWKRWIWYGNGRERGNGMCDWWEWKNEKVMREELSELMNGWVSEWKQTHLIHSFTLDLENDGMCFYAWHGMTSNVFHHSPILTSFHQSLSPSFPSHVPPATTRRYECLPHHWSKVPFIKWR